MQMARKIKKPDVLR